jgi:hypothetical protein
MAAELGHRPVNVLASTAREVEGYCHPRVSEEHPGPGSFDMLLTLALGGCHALAPRDAGVEPADVDPPTVSARALLNVEIVYPAGSMLK